MYRTGDEVRPFFRGLELSSGTDMAAAGNGGDAVELEGRRMKPTSEDPHPLVDGSEAEA